MISENRFTKYLLYAFGEIILVVIGILIALQISNINEEEIRVKKEVEILKSFRDQFQLDLNEFEASLQFYKGAKASINLLIEELEADKPYRDSLKYHFFTSTRTWGTSDLDNTTFESFQSIGVDLITNTEIRSEISLIYGYYDPWIRKFEDDYMDYLMDASETLFPTRFEEFWKGDYTDSSFGGEMIPLDFDKLKSDQEYLYFLKTQRNHIGWMIEKPLESARPRIESLIQEIDKEISLLEQ